MCYIVFINAQNADFPEPVLRIIPRRNIVNGAEINEFAHIISKMQKCAFCAKICKTCVFEKSECVNKQQIQERIFYILNESTKEERK